MNQNQKKERNKIIIASIIFGIFLFTDINETIDFIKFLLLYFYIGWDILKKSFKNIINGNVFDENFLMSIATIGAFLLGEYHEALEVMIFYRVGELFQDYAMEQSRESIVELMNIAPEYATLKQGDVFVQVDPEDVSVGSIIMVKAGEKIPLDGRVVSGSSMLNTAALTGESKLKTVTEGDEVVSGCINVNHVLMIQSTKSYEDSTVSKIMELVESSYEKKAKTEKYITKFARYYTPFVVIFAVVLCLIPPVLFHQSFHTWIYRSLTFLVISCPCALVVSIPLSFFSGIGSGAHHGVLIKGGEYIERLSNLETIVFDKTGTLTEGNFKVEGLYSDSMPQELLWDYVVLSEVYCNHPIAISLREQYHGSIDYKRIKDYREFVGLGIVSQIDDKEICIGNEKLMRQEEVTIDNTILCNSNVVYIAIDHEYVGYILLEDKIKEDSPEVIDRIKSMGIKNIVIFTGDEEEISKSVAKSLGIENVCYELLPQDKVYHIEELLHSKSKNKFVGFVGDGINDAPVLSRVDVGISMGRLGSDAAIEASDVVLMDDNILKIPFAIELSKRTMLIIKENIIFSLGVKGIVLFLTAVGILGMQWAVFSDVGVSVLAILNAFRIKK